MSRNFQNASRYPSNNIVTSICVYLDLSVPYNSANIFILLILSEGLATDTLLQLTAERVVRIAILTLFANQIFLALDLLLLMFCRLLLFHEFPPLNVSVELFNSFTFKELHPHIVFSISFSFFTRREVFVVTIQVKQCIGHLITLLVRGSLVARLWSLTLLDQFLLELGISLL